MQKRYEERCKNLLDLAINHVPYYKEWKKYDLDETHSIDERFNHLPTLDKEGMRNSFPMAL